MRWYQERVTRRDQRIAREIATSFGVEHLKFNHRKNMYGYFDIKPDKSHVICLPVKRDKRWFYSALLHEISHSVCMRHRIFPQYHFLAKIRDLTPKQRLAVRRTALRAELYVDTMAEGICRKLFCKLPYQQAYRRKKERIFLRDFWRDRWSIKPIRSYYG